MTIEDHNLQIARSLGELTGAVKAMGEAMTAQLNDIKSDIRRLETSHSERVDRLERGFDQRFEHFEASVAKSFDHLDKRVSSLEQEDVNMREKFARISAMGGGIGGMLAYALSELAKHAIK